MRINNRLLTLAGLIAATLSTHALAFGEPGRWSSGWGQGTSEYTVVDTHNNSLYIACGDAPVSMTLTLGGKRYGSNEKLGFSLVIDGKQIDRPYDTASRVGAENFIYVWDGLRKAKSLQARTEDGKTVALPLVGAAKALPRSFTKDFPCKTDF